MAGSGRLYPGSSGSIEGDPGGAVQQATEVGVMEPSMIVPVKETLLSPVLDEHLRPLGMFRTAIAPFGLLPAKEPDAEVAPLPGNESPS